MRIRDLLDEKSISLNATPADKPSAIKDLVELMDKAGKLSDKDQYLKDVLARESTGSADPIRVIPSVAIGAATAGALSMAFECTLRAPHGGIFVVPTIGNPFMYLLAILIGAIVGCAIMAVLKKPIR